MSEPRTDLYDLIYRLHDDGAIDEDQAGDLCMALARSEARSEKAAPRAEGLDPHRLGGLIERAIRDSKRASGGLLPDGWTLLEMALAYPPETPTEPSQSIREETPE